MTETDHKDFCRKLCEEFDLMFADGIRPHPKAMSAISKAIQIVMEKAARTADDAIMPESFRKTTIYTEFERGGDEYLTRAAQAIRSLQLSAEDVADSLRSKND